MAQDSITNDRKRYLLWVTWQHIFRLVRRLQSAKFKEVGVSYDRFMILVTIDARGGSVKVSDIAEHLNRSTNSVSMLGDRMVKDGLITKTRQKTDRRAVYMATTSQGKMLIERGTNSTKTLLTSLFSGMSDDEVNTLLNLMREIGDRAVHELGFEGDKERGFVDYAIDNFFSERDID